MLSTRRCHSRRLRHCSSLISAQRGAYFSKISSSRFAAAASFESERNLVVVPVASSSHAPAGPRASFRTRRPPRAGRAHLRPTGRFQSAPNVSPTGFPREGLRNRRRLENLDRVAIDCRSERETGERRHQLLDRRAAVDMQVRVAVPPDRPDDEQKNDDAEAQRQRDHQDCRQPRPLTSGGIGTGASRTDRRPRIPAPPP
jgi:hypothetical protein